MLNIIKITVFSLLVGSFYNSVQASFNLEDLAQGKHLQPARTPFKLKDKTEIKRNNITQINNVTQVNVIVIEKDDVGNSIPTGSILNFAGNTAPQGWLFCDGTTYSNQKYPQLYDTIGTKYVPTGSWILQANQHTEYEKFFMVPIINNCINKKGSREAVARADHERKFGPSSYEQTQNRSHIIKY